MNSNTFKRYKILAASHRCLYTRQNFFWTRSKFSNSHVLIQFLINRFVGLIMFPPTIFDDLLFYMVDTTGYCPDSGTFHTKKSCLFFQPCMMMMIVVSLSKWCLVGTSVHNARVSRISTRWRR